MLAARRCGRVARCPTRGAARTSRPTGRCRDRCTRAPSAHRRPTCASGTADACRAAGRRSGASVGHGPSLGLTCDRPASPAATGGRDPRDRSRRRSARCSPIAHSPLAWLRRSDGIVGARRHGRRLSRRAARHAGSADPRTRSPWRTPGGASPRQPRSTIRSVSTAPGSSRSARSPSTRGRARRAGSSSPAPSSAAATGEPGSPRIRSTDRRRSRARGAGDAVRPVLVGDARSGRARPRGIPGRRARRPRRDRRRRGRQGRARARPRRHRARGRGPAPARARARRPATPTPGRSPSTA